MLTRVNKIYHNGVIFFKNIKKEFTIANKPFTVSVVSKRQLKKCVPSASVENHFRFCLAPYDMNLKRLYCQYKWDKRVLEGFKKYNHEEK